MVRQQLNDGWRVRAPRGPFEAIEAGGSTAGEIAVTLPHDALRDVDRSPYVPGGGAAAYYPPSAFTYLRTLDAPADWSNKLVVLEFQGAMRHAQVFVNEEFAANRSDGYARFLVDITPFLQLGRSNELRVEVRTGQDSRWYSGAGLHREVILHVLPLVHIPVDGVTVRTLHVEAGRATLEAATEIRNAGHRTANVHLSTQLRGPLESERAIPATLDSNSSPVTVPPGRTVLVRHRLYVDDPQLWSEHSPALYETVSSLASDAADAEAVVTAVGIRTVTADPRHGLRVNGEPVLLRGACVHHDNGPLGGAAIARAEERRIELLKASGFNAIRLSHNPASVAMLEACDRLGMYVMDEAFDMWVRFKKPYDYAMDFAQWWREDLTALVMKDRNHPSVLMYSLGNEIAEVGMPHGSVLARDMAEHVRSLDPTRLVTNGVNMSLVVLDEVAAEAAQAAQQAGDTAPSEGSVDSAGLNDLGGLMNEIGMRESATQRTAESHAALDVAGVNYAEGRYALDEELFPHRVLVGSETFPSQIGRLWPLVEKHPHVIGDFTWTGWDYLGEVGIGATAYAEDAEAVAALEREYPYLTADCGDLDITGRRRPISFYREVVFGLRTEPYIAVLRPERHGHTVTMQSPWAWSDAVSSWTWPGFEGKPVTVEVYADADEVELQVDGRTIGRERVAGPESDRPRLARIETTYAPGTLVAIAYRGDTEIGRTTLRTASGAASLRVRADRGSIAADPRDLAFISIEIVDADGTVFTGAPGQREVTVQVSGAGALAGLGSGNPRTAERFDAQTVTTFDGAALAIVRPLSGHSAGRHDQGQIQVTVTSAGLDPVTVTVATH